MNFRFYLVDDTTHVILYHDSGKNSDDDIVRTKLLSQVEPDITEELVIKKVIKVVECSQLNDGLYVRHHRVSKMM